jgi:hypothetical protein
MKQEHGGDNFFLSFLSVCLFVVVGPEEEFFV